MRKGQRHSDATKQKMSLAKKGKPSTQKGKHHSAETKEKLRKIFKGKKKPPRSEEHCRNISVALRLKIATGWAPMRGRHHTEEGKKNISQSQKGKSRNPESIRRMRISLTGKKASPETRERHRQTAKRGAEHWKWRGGNNNHKLYRGWSPEVRDAIKVRDNWQCIYHDVECSKRLDVHHILPYYFCQEQSIDEPHNHKNLVSLCSKHHSKVENDLIAEAFKLSAIIQATYGYSWDDDFLHSIAPALADYVTRKW